jgi:hypothetical protein
MKVRIVTVFEVDAEKWKEEASLEANTLPAKTRADFRSYAEDFITDLAQQGMMRDAGVTVAIAKE